MITVCERDAASRPISRDSSALDLELLDWIIDEFKEDKGAALPILQQTQDAFGYLPRTALEYIAEKTLIPLNQLYGVATFYRQFHLAPQGKHIIRVCDGTACHVCGSCRNLQAVQKALGITPGSTTPDGEFTLEVVYCLGACSRSPVALLDDKVYGRLTPPALLRQIEMLR